MNKHEENRQFITCSGDMYVLIWDLLKPEQDTDAPAQPTAAIAEEVYNSSCTPNFTEFLQKKSTILSFFKEDEAPKFKPRLSTWARLRAKSSVQPIKSGEKWSPATGEKTCF